MKRFLKNEQGEVSGFVIVLACISIVAAFSFSVVKEKVKCTQTTTDDRIGLVVDDKDIVSNTPENCHVKGVESSPSVDPVPTPPVVPVIDPPVIDVGDPPPGDPPIDLGAGSTPPDGYVPISYYDAAGVSLTCNDSLSYYDFTIPSNAAPDSRGTKTLQINNQQGWDMWVEITSITPGNSLGIDSYDQLYKFLPNGGSTTLDVRWYWHPSVANVGNLGNARVYFKIVCTEPDPSKMNSSIPEKPQNFIATSRTDTSISLKWDPVVNTSEYKLRIDGSSGEEIYYNNTDLKTNYTVNGLMPDSTYWFALRAGNENGISTYNEKSFTTTGTVFENFRVTNVTNSSISVAWDAVPNAIKYQIKLDGVLVHDSPATSYTVTGLSPGTNYSFKIWAVDGHVETNAKVISVTTTGTSPYPIRPRNFIVADRTDTTMKLTWDASAGATSYTLRKENTVIYTGPATSVTVTGLLPDTQYRYYVYASNSNGNSNESYATEWTKYVNLNDTNVIGTTCQNQDFTKTFTIPSTAKPGDSGTFKLTIANNSNQKTLSHITSVTKTGGLFGGTNPITLSYDNADKTILSNASLDIPITWSFPTQNGTEYDGKTGTVTVDFTVSCQ